MKTSELLIAAKAKIANPVNWLSGGYATDSEGQKAYTWSKNATCFCSVGAARSAMRLLDKINTQVFELLNQAAGGCVIEFNDSHTHEQVMVVWDKAIALALAEEAA